MGQYVVMACVGFMVVGGVIAVVGRVMRRIERRRRYAGEDPPSRGLIVMLVGAALFVPAAILLVLMVKYF
jgi:NhaP-type Na+/H+ or K+/H+ antiporter